MQNEKEPINEKVEKIEVKQGFLHAWPPRVRVQISGVWYRVLSFNDFVADITNPDNLEIDEPE